MKFPSFIKTSKHSRFNYEPRYYDPIKEEIKGKMEAAKRRLNSDEPLPSYTSSISEAFNKRERKAGQASIIQMVLAAVLLGTFVGWLFYGNDVFYVYLILSPIYFYFRLKTAKSKK